MLNNLKNIAFIVEHGEDSPHSGLGDHAARIARSQNAHLIGIYGIDTAGGHPASGHVRGTAALQEAAARRQREQERHVIRAGRHLADLSNRFGISAEFRVVMLDHVETDIARHSIYCDLVMVGHPPSGRWPAEWAPDRILAESGSPVLIVPEGWQGDTIGKRVMVAWNGSREARRSITDAMPFILAADEVRVVVVDAEGDPRWEGGDPGATIAHHLARHGARIEVDQIKSDGKPVAEALLAHAQATESDLLVIGAYSRSRMYQRLFGGVTTTLLAETPIPLLISD